MLQGALPPYKAPHLAWKHPSQVPLTGPLKGGVKHFKPAHQFGKKPGLLSTDFISIPAESLPRHFYTKRLGKLDKS
jgi:hypothetical protein